MRCSQCILPTLHPFLTPHLHQHSLELSFGPLFELTERVYTGSLCWSTWWGEKGKVYWWDQYYCILQKNSHSHMVWLAAQPHSTSGCPPYHQLPPGWPRTLMEYGIGWIYLNRLAGPKLSQDPEGKWEWLFMTSFISTTLNVWSTQVTRLGPSWCGTGRSLCYNFPGSLQFQANSLSLLTGDLDSRMIQLQALQVWPVLNSTEIWHSFFPMCIQWWITQWATQKMELWCNCHNFIVGFL